jgi:serine/threonine protein kinase
MLVMEYADNGTLRECLGKSFGNLTWDDKFEMACQLARAVSCLHNESTIIHRDLVIHLYYNICIIQLLFVV